MNALVLPLRAILFQGLFLLIAIALEAVVLQERLTLSRRRSVEYAAVLNLLSTLAGWIVFLILEPLLPQILRAQLISYVFFNQFFSYDWSPNMNPVLVIGGLSTFLGTVALEVRGLLLIQQFEQQTSSIPNPDPPRSRPSLVRTPTQNPNAQLRQSPTFALLIANALSYSAILVILSTHFFLTRLETPPL